MFQKIRYIAIGVFLLFAASGLSAQTVQELRLGSSLSATLRAGDEQWYNVRVTEECFVVVETSGGSVDTYLEVFDASNNIIARNDDGGEGVNAKVEFHALPGRTYRLKLTGFNSDDSGPYRIWASQKPLPRPTELRIGASHSGNLGEGGDHWYRVTSSGVNFLVVETFGNRDTYLEAYDTSFNFISENDDGGENGNARLEFITGSSKTFLIRVRFFYPDESGPYTISASQRALPNPTELRIGASHSGNLDEGGSNWYRITPSGNGLLVLEITSSMDTFLEIYDSSYNFISEDDDGGEYSNARLELYVEAGKTYFIRLRGYGRWESGPYRLWVSFESIR